MANTAIVGVENKEGLQSLLSEIQSKVETALSRYITREKVEQLAFIAASRQPKLFKCTKSSLAQAIMRAGQIGITVQYERAVIVNLKGKTESRIGYIVSLKEVKE